MILIGPHTYLDTRPEARCTHCGTTYEHHERAAQPCVPHLAGEKVMPEPTRRTLACEDIEAIHARMAELDKEHLEALNTAEPVVM